MKKTTIEISVIMGVYNPKNKEQLMAAVASIVNQTFQNWEMLLYDDGSEPTYIPVIQEAANMDSRITLIRNPKNHGLAYGPVSYTHLTLPTT